MARLRLASLCFAVLVLGFALTAKADPRETATTSAQPAKIQFNRDVQPILSTNCYTCHGPDKGLRKAGLRLDTATDAIKELKTGNKAIVPGNVKDSELIARIFSTGKDLMPPPNSNHQLKPAQKELLKRWIEEGAEYQPHWAFVAPKRPQLPKVKDAQWARNPIDYFILAKLEAEGLKPMAEADRYTLARRVAIDLTGLPPSLEMVDRFIKDKSADAYEKYVDEILKLPAYGERWAQPWLDLARYADSNGYAHDAGRSIWPYRDWVIEAINANLPFDKFTIEQIAGDMLPSPTLSQQIATGFHRNTLMNDEGGSQDEEFRVVAVVDRVNTTMQVWMGLTMACAQCHDHKYDPISQEEYFRMYAIFNQSQDNNNKSNQPTIPVPGAAAPPSKDKKMAGKGVTTMIMKELPEKKQRVTKIHIRGDFLNQGKVVQPGLPAAFPALPEGTKPNRLSLAKWLVDPANPLTARVTANRYWDLVFGMGLVETPEDFGIRSSLPNHPDLLDWLATEFVSPTKQKGEAGKPVAWDVKRLLKLFVTSATYRQSSKVPPELAERDRDNRLFARGPRQRATAEMIRDQALFVGGLLSPKMYGPPVRPPQPVLNLKAAFNVAINWEVSKGEDKYRRALYTQWFRYTPYPSMATFGAPDRNVCTVTRPKTNTPLQALVTLNDPCFVETAQALARRMVKEGGATIESKVTYGFRLCLIRPPQEVEAKRLVELFKQAREEYAKQPKEAQKFATDPLGPLPEGMEPVELAAYTVVANVLLNLDEALAKR
ncbi:MAG TPA: PSD1 and planctomycete cytochrome C domain-containing protein [Gemmataceae bacterium]|nr:PSD1 and planctomycete cytochrome C domain-containing protein [Gemmataceae bacterium]